METKRESSGYQQEFLSTPMIAFISPIVIINGFKFTNIHRVRKMNTKIVATAVILLILMNVLTAQSIVNTVHNLSVSGPGTIKATSESQICIFCHTPHSTSPHKPLWNRPDPGGTYTLYTSSTTDALPGQPTGSAILCLSCHDGTIALGNVLNRSTPIGFGTISILTGRSSDLTQDLSNDHPISFVYDATLATTDGELVDPAVLTNQVQLENGQLQCISCHDAHNNIYGDFLTAPTSYSQLCMFCHTKNYWNNSSHKNSVATWNGSGNDPWFHTDYNNVAENGCENCHNPHNADGNERLLNYQLQEDNCLNCHNQNVASTNILADLSKPYIHDVFAYNTEHDPQEGALVLTRHVECVDCHNPHAANNQSATPPVANGYVQGIKGIDSNGNPVDPIQYSYELCYRCHADTPDKPASPTPRVLEQNNVRLEFDLSNPSYHPIEGPGKNNNVPSLIPPLTESSVIYCTDCHASSGTGAAMGPHGSIYPQILKYRYEKTFGTQESYQAYRLCYECHNRNEIINSGSNFGKKVHKKHVVSEDVPCNACHDPHGISISQGNSTNNSHLINFDISLVSPDPNTGKLEFQDQGNFKGRCYLECHGEKHSPKSY
ncbi:MAG: hypothetical protein D6748_01000 [Calditrichaeota bacterium]|nr:MAG: hypothetical protein D6748_01000 [Calditrichota bacterium]